ncbi:protein kinase [Heterostelium album PN500]|uniref:Protein kinase n=1 Tax=Heterostelium pallidum (strain ATCC 26659 / Pp 5 / PN500) TaxID=670386 RepID=D3BKN7_HETP5|nr:protein kinase [Heterostelium album PN500]EFA78467.1 protein kinase [Heterostelium album PN500]|eukprot:XP_020430591.1 protein kinase [Heterostelium album PN500]
MKYYRETIMLYKYIITSYWLMEREPTLSTSLTFLTGGSSGAGSTHLFIDDNFSLGGSVSNSTNVITTCQQQDWNMQKHLNSGSIGSSSSSHKNCSSSSSIADDNSSSDGSDKFQPPANSKLLPSNIHNLDWSRVVHVESCQYKNQKNTFSLFYVTFSKLVDDKEHYFKVMLKTSNNITQEVYSSILATICRIPIPTMRLVEYSTPEFASMSKNLQRFSSDLLFKKELKKKFFLVMECVEGKPLGELNIKEFFNEKKYPTIHHPKMVGILPFWIPESTSLSTVLSQSVTTSTSIV